MFKNVSWSGYSGDGDLEPLSSKVVLNPLEKFPSKRDTITKAFYGHEVKKHSRAIDSKEQWLSADDFDPSFGVKGSNQRDQLRRTYRRITASSLFSSTTIGQVSLSELTRPSVPTEGKKYVLVEESKLAELTHFENLLREERQKLGEQCVVAKSTMSFPELCPAHIPVPATRMAVHSLCEAEMKKHASEILRLQTSWREFCKQNHFDKPHLFLKESYLDSAPPSQRAMKLKLVKEAAENWRQRKDRSTMQFEDDLSYFTGLYVQAQIRKRDYDRYYVLATRYGIWSEDRFKKDNRPGKRYWMLVTMGALKFQRLWDRFWAVRKLKRYRAARSIQTKWRGYTVYHKLHPLIRLRLKVGRRSTFQYYFNRWNHYNYCVRRIRELIQEKLISRRNKCFIAWKNYQQGDKKRRADILKRFCLRMQNSGVALTLMAWQAFTKRRKQGKLFMRRLLQCPHFDLWVEYTKMSKHMKRLNRAARMFQSVVRGHIVRKKFRRLVRARDVLTGFASIILCKKAAQVRRDKRIDIEFEEWEPKEIVRIGIKANEIERRRLVHQQQVLADKETKAVQAMKKHLKSKNGIIQLSEYCSQIRSGSAVTVGTLDKKKPRSQAIKDLARGELLRRAKAISRTQEKHDYTVKHPPFVICADPACQAVFTTEEQYHTHMMRAPYHEDKPKYSKFHLQLKNSKGQELYRSFLTRTRGIDCAINCLDAWISIQEWKKALTTTPAFVSKAANINETFLTSDCTRPLRIPESDFDGIGAISEKISDVKDREFFGFLQPAEAEVSAWRHLFGLQGKKYEEWTERTILPADIFEQLEWHCFMNVFKAISDDPSFLASDEFRSFELLAESDAKFRTSNLFEEFKLFRMDEYRHWAVGFKLHEKNIGLKADDVVGQILTSEIERLVDIAVNLSVKEKVFEVQHAEQKQHEEMQLLVDDALCWTELNITEEIYEYYVSSLLATMWSMPELRKGMLQYSGLLKHSKYKAVSAKALLINMNTRSKAKDEWFDDFVNDAMAKEKESLPLLAGDAATRIQKVCRGMLGRKLARREFGNTFYKRYDSSSQQCYYVNIVLGTSSWERPRLFSRLYPSSKW